MILFALPHFIVGPYKPVNTRTSGLCPIPNTTINHSAPECKAPSGGEWYYMMIFVVAQLIIGAGISPFYSHLPVYLDENVDPKSMPVYLGIWYIFTFLGPGVGSFIAGKFLSIYVDIEQVCLLIRPFIVFSPMHTSILAFIGLSTFAYPCMHQSIYMSIYFRLPKNYISFLANESVFSSNSIFGL